MTRSSRRKRPAITHHRLTYSPPLNGLRGIAIALVVAFHANWLAGGWIGVDLFFVISGYLITRLLLDELHDHGHVDVKQFWKRRARRLLPALLALIVVIAVVERMRNPSVRTARWDVFGALTYCSNWVRIALGESYWDRLGPPGLADHLWSLAIEEQFYLVWPLLVAVGARWFRTPRVFAATILVLAISAALYSVMVFQVTGEAARVYLGTDTRAFALLCGATVGAWAAIGLRVPTRVGTTLALLGLGYFAVAFDGSYRVVYRGGLVVVAATAAVLVATLIRPVPVVANLMSVRPLTWLGERSYGLYLWHWPVFVAFGVAERPRSATSTRLTAIAASMVLAELSARVLELPIRRAVSVKRWVLVGGGLIAASAATVTLFPKQKPVETLSSGGPQVTLPAPPKPLVNTTATTAAEPVPASTSATSSATSAATPAATPGVSAQQNTSPPPTVLAQVSAPVVMLVGDSVGGRIGVSLARAPDPRAVVVNRARAGCMLSRRHMVIREVADAVEMDVGEACAAYVRSFAEFVEDMAPEAVVVAFGAGFFHQAQIADGVWANACAPAFREFMFGELQAAVAALTSAGARVFVITEAYYRAPNEPDYGRRDDETDCKTKLLNDAASQPGAGFTLLPLGQVVCPKRDPCPVDGLDIRADGIHYDGASGRIVWDWLYEQMFP